MNTTEHFYELWKESRTRFDHAIKDLDEAGLSHRLGDAVNSAGWLIRHIADVELLFAKNIFGQQDLKVRAETVISKKDSGEYTHWKELMEYQQSAYEAMEQAINAQADSEWQEEVSTKEFGTKTKAEALGRIVSHTAYHSGQLAWLSKYGK
ncbi:MAG: DinB family protein [Cyclobacteriaceae bacterium]|nr:DinB family protein [Cyclobacteriaceae bacterium]MCH8514827.1 DinB family protein [Cyclobacteriaceae bacterium]